MSDKEKLIKLLDSFGLEPSDGTWPPRNGYLVLEKSVTLGSGDGTPGAETTFYFDNNGNFSQYGVFGE